MLFPRLLGEGPLTATQIAKSIDLLTAIWWVKQAWNAVSADTMINCFKYCGVQPRTDEVTDPFADLDEKSEDEQEGDSGSQDEELQELVQQFEPELNARDYILMLMKICLPVTLMTTMKIGEMSYVMKYCPVVMQKKKQAISENDSEEEDESDEESPSIIMTFREAIHCGNNFLKFLTEKGEEQLSENMFKIVQQLQVSQLNLSVLSSNS